MSYTKSLSLFVPAATLDAANAYMEKSGRGPGTFSRPLWKPGVAAPSHHGAHTYDDALLEELRASGEAETLGIEWLWADGRSALENFGFLASFHGLLMEPDVPQ
jgi:hypothetical protein